VDHYISEDFMIAKITMDPMRVLDPKMSANYVGGEDNLYRLIDNDWLQALPGKSKGMEYDIRDLDRCIDRVKLEGWPASKRRKRDQ
jgi:hypothetical protein